MSIAALLAVFAGLMAWFFRNKAQSNAALVDNQEATKELNTIDQSLAKNQGLLEAEELKRKNNEVSDVSNEDLVDFVNKRLPPL